MPSEVTDSQKRKIKELVDQIIVNHGVLPESLNISDIDGMQADQLYRTAFKYYKMIYSGESPLDIDLKMALPDIPKSKPPSISPDPRCIGCDKPLSEEDSQMPVCRDCRTQLKADYEMLKNLLR